MNESSEVAPKQMLEPSVSLSQMAEAVLPAQEPPPHHIDVAYVRSIIRARRLRDQYFPAGLFADPAWDMLLELYAARLEGYAVWISSLCIASCVPSTTALRWVKSLCDQGLLVRKADERDSRRVFIELSDQAAVAMSGYLAAARQASEMAT